MIALLVGIVFLVFGVIALAFFGQGGWADEFIVVLKGSLPPIAILSGLAALALGISQIRDKIAAKKEEEELAAEEAEAPAPEPEKAEGPKPAEPPKEKPRPEAKPEEPEKEERAGQ
jgi:outer membrane biosynthesis protein TonB